MIRFLVAFSNRPRLKGDSVLVEILFEIGSPCSLELSYPFATYQPIFNACAADSIPQWKLRNGPARLGMLESPRLKRLFLWGCCRNIRQRTGARNSRRHAE